MHHPQCSGCTNHLVHWCELIPFHSGDCVKESSPDRKLGANMPGKHMRNKGAVVIISAQGNGASCKAKELGFCPFGGGEDVTSGDSAAQRRMGLKGRVSVAVSLYHHYVSCRGQ